MTVEIISLSISTKVWDRAVIKLATPGSAVRHVSVARHVAHCATWPGKNYGCKFVQKDHFNAKKFCPKKSAAGMQHTPPWDIFNAKKLILKLDIFMQGLRKICKEMPKIESEKKQFVTSIKGHNSVLICQNLSICNTKTLLFNINSYTQFEKNR